MATRKRITLPSGGTCMVRKLSSFDVAETGDLPNVLPEAKPSRQTAENDKKSLAFGVKMARIALTKCVSPIRNPDKSTTTIVDKAFSECSDEEITVEELDQEDANAIVSAVFELSKITKEATAKVEPFPTQETVAVDAAQDGEGLRKAAV